MQRARLHVHNHFHAELRDATTGEVLQEADAYNVLTNEGREDLAQNFGLEEFGRRFMGGCAVGTGTQAPAATDTTLAQQVSYAEIARSEQVANPTSFVADAATGVFYRRHRYQFAEDVANYGLTEVGLYRNTSPDGFSADNSSFTTDETVHSRALFKDANGSPITVTKDSSQILTITATVYIQRGAVDDGLALLDTCMTRFVSAGEFPEDGTLWQLGNGTVPPADTDAALSGAELDSINTRFETDGGVNRLAWDASGGRWLDYNDRPAAMRYTSTVYVDWGLSRGNHTFSEVLVIGNQHDSDKDTHSIARIVFPCGTVAESSYTKTDQVKLRQYFEINWS